MLTFDMALFATFVTRAGGLWTSSVHSYGSVTAEGATARLWELLNRSPSVLGIFLLMILVLFIAFLMYYRNRGSPAKEEKEAKPFQTNDSNSMLIAVFFLSATILIMLLILLKNVDMTFIANYDEFNQKMAFLFIALIISLIVCLSWRRIGSKNALYLGIVMIAMTLASGLIGASLGSDVILSLFLPSLLVAVLFTLYRIGKSYQKGSWRKTVNNLGPQLVHLGIVLLLVGYVFSSFTQVFQQLGRSAN